MRLFVRFCVALVYCIIDTVAVALLEPNKNTLFKVLAVLASEKLTDKQGVGVQPCIDARQTATTKIYEIYRR